jgi:hypothetical protein
MNQTQKSLSFVLPSLNLTASNIEATYLGDVDYYGDNRWGEHFFVLFKNLTNAQSQYLRNREDYVHEYDPIPNHTMVVFSLNDIIKEQVITPFIDGKYSKIDRFYVDKYFKPTTSFGTMSTNYLILTKSPILRDFWEERLGVRLPEDAEVWSRPEKKSEVYNYKGEGCTSP